MQFLVLGAGLQGAACAFDLLRSRDCRVTLGDRKIGDLPRFLDGCSQDRLKLVEVDARDEASILQLMGGHQGVLCALPFYFNFEIARMAVAAGVHFADLGGNTEIVREQETLHEAAIAKGVSVLPDCGLAPGMVNILAVDGIARLDRAVTVKLFVGGLPQHPKPPLNYQIVYSLEGALDYYTTPSWILRDGSPTQVDPLTELEDVIFPEPVGTLEAFHTAGGLSTMPWDFQGALENMEYKTLRYPGHAHVMKAIRDLGLLDLDPVEVDGTTIRPRDAFIAAVDPKLRVPDGRDLVALRVVVTGERNGKPASVSYRLLDMYDDSLGMSAMMRATAFSLSITGQMQVDGRIAEPGVRPAFKATPASEYISELSKRGLDVVVEES